LASLVYLILAYKEPERIVARARIVNDDRRYIDWDKSSSGHPKYLTTYDLNKMTGSKKLLARKFSLAVDKNILDIIDRKLDTEAS
jgi:hypothetical protein